MLVNFLFTASGLTNSDVAKTCRKISLSELLDFRDHGCTKHVDDLLSVEQRLLASMLKNKLQIFGQIFRDHLISLVDDAPGKSLQRQLMLFNEFFHSSWCCYKNLTTFVQLYGLQLKLIASNCHKGFQIEPLSYLFKLLFDLFCEFSCWNYDQGIRTSIESFHGQSFQRNEELNDGKQVCQSFSLACWSNRHEITMSHADRDGLHLDRFRLLEVQFQQIFDQSFIDALDFFPFSDWIWSLPSSYINLVVLSKNSPISVFHLLKRFILPRSHAFHSQDVFVFVCHLSKNGNEALTCVFPLVPLKQQLISVLHISSLRQLHFGQTQYFVLHLVSLLSIILQHFLILGIS